MASSPSLAEARSHNVPPEVFLRLWREIRDAKQAHADTGMALARAKKSAKNAGVDMDAFKDVEKWADLDEDEIRMRESHKRVYAGWLKLPIGTQTEMFKAAGAGQPTDDAREEHEEWQAEQAGLAAGKSGKRRQENPHQPGLRTHVAWDKNWAKGNKDWTREQKRIAGEMGENSTRRRRGAAGADEVVEAEAAA